MALTSVVNVKIDEYDIYVGRKNKTYNLKQYIYANPFKLERERDRDHIYNLYERWLKFQYRWQEKCDMDWQLDFLKGKRLGCWCSPKKCHADLLAKLADMTYEQRVEWANA